MVQYLPKGLPRLPLDGSLDLTYRCNNNCIHCWLWQPNTPQRIKTELSFDEIRRIISEARQMGCQAWAISGGEPMLRADFAEIFEFITRKSVSYKLNTNGTLITPEIARLLARKGNKMVALYGATAEVHDRITRNPGSFDATMRGFSYLKEAGAGFVVQIIPMKANYHQYEAMLQLAQSLSSHYRIGAPWLWLSANRSKTRNCQIAQQRLDPADVIDLDKPYPNIDTFMAPQREDPNPDGSFLCATSQRDNCLFSACIASRRDFHIDPYGQMSFCYYVKNPNLRYNLRLGNFHQAWEEFIPSLVDAITGDQEYLENCGSCPLRQDCRWCAVYAYLEHGRYSAKIDYLCQVAALAKNFKEDWIENHIRYYQIAGITIQVSADFTITDETFTPNIRSFQVEKPGEDLVSLRLNAKVPPLSELKLEKEVYRKTPWAVYQQSRSWVYLGIESMDSNENPRSVAIFNQEHTQGTIFYSKSALNQTSLGSVSMFPSDQVLIARLLADRQACYLHASGIIIDGNGLIFVGHSEAGKSTMLKMLHGKGEILCDDRMILRRWSDGFHIHGSWSHGELPDVSPAGAPLKAIFYLEKAETNAILPLLDKKEQLGRFLSYVIRPLVTSDWWEKTLNMAGKVTAEVPAYRLLFDKSGTIVDLLQQLK